MGILVLADAEGVFEVLASNSWRGGGDMYYMEEDRCVFMAERAQGGVMFRAHADDPYMHGMCVSKLRRIVESIVVEVHGAQVMGKLELAF